LVWKIKLTTRTFIKELKKNNPKNKDQIKKNWNWSTKSKGNNTNKKGKKNEGQFENNNTK